MGRTSRARLERLADEELVAMARAGDHRAVEEILRRYEPRIQRVCRRVCRSEHDAQDAAQDTLASINVGLRRFDGRSSLSTWVHRIATNRSLDELRRRHRRPEPAGDPESSGALDAADDPTTEPERAAVSRETRDALIAALAELPDVLADAVVLRDVADLDYATIATELGIPLGTVRSRIARGRAQLAEVLRSSPGWNQPGGTDVPLDDT